MEKTTYNGLGHDPLNFGARHDCKNAKGFWVAEREVLVEEDFSKS